MRPLSKFTPPPKALAGLRAARRLPSCTTSESTSNLPFSYPASRNPRTDPAHSGFDAGPLAEQLSQFTPVPIPYKAPIDYARIGTGMGVLLIILSGVRAFLPILRSRWLWAAGTVLTSLIMTSGFMFVRIRGMPHSGGNGQWIAPNYQNQFGQEVQVVSFICESHLYCPVEGAPC